MSRVDLASGDCGTPGTLLKTWLFTYDGDGARVKQVYTEGTSTLTTYYYAGGSYEIQKVGSTETVRHAVFAPPSGFCEWGYYAIAGMTVAMRAPKGVLRFTSRKAAP